MPLGVAVVGGMVFSTFLTLILVPVVYTFMARYTKARLNPETPASAGGSDARHGGAAEAGGDSTRPTHPGPVIGGSPAHS